MEHFVAYEHGEGNAISLESTGRLHVQSRKQGHLLRALNNKVWLVHGTRAGGRTRYMLHGVYIAATISEAASGEYLIDGTDGIDFDPPIALNDFPWFDLVRDSRSNLRTGFNRITDENLIDRLLDIEHRARRSRRPRAKAARSSGKDEGTRVSSTRGSSPAQRRNAAIRERAMTCALEYFRLRWRNVADVSGREAYDIHCDDPKGRILTVMVRGTTEDWENLLLTAAEERHAREAYPDVALFVLHEISLVTNSDGEPVARGGVTHVIDPWDISIDELSPLIFGCRLARVRSAKEHAR